jgi:hypothetical protein
MTISACWMDGRLRIDAYKPDPRLAPLEVGFALYLTAEQADWLRRIIDAGPDPKGSDSKIKSPRSFPDAG